MRNDKHIAVLYRKQGKSYKQIEKELGIARSTLSDWFSNVKWSQAIKRKLTRDANYINHNRFRKVVRARTIMWEQWRESARQEAREEFPKLVKDPLFVAGIMLYWGEGDSKLENSQVDLANTDQYIIRLFSAFLRKFCTISPKKFRGEMILYPDLNENECKKFWSQVSGIPEDQFYKTQFIKGKHPTRRLSHGVFMLRFSSRQFKEKIYVWINLFHNQYSSR